MERTDLHMARIIKIVCKSGNIEFVVAKREANTAPMETQTQRRVYVTVDKNTNELKYI